MSLCARSCPAVPVLSRFCVSVRPLVVFACDCRVYHRDCFVACGVARVNANGNKFWFLARSWILPGRSFIVVLKIFNSFTREDCEELPNLLRRRSQSKYFCS